MTLLGKSPKNGRVVTLVQHTCHVLEAAEAMFGTAAQSKRLGERWLAFFKIAERWREFHAALLAAAAFHDWGKANDGMQAVLTRSGGQCLRHEHLSALLLAQPGVQSWVSRRADVDWGIVLAAVLGHHLQAGYKDLDTPPEPGAGLTLLHEDDDFKELMHWIADRVGLDVPPPALSAASRWAYRNFRGTLPAGARDISEGRRNLVQQQLRPLETALRRDPARARLLWAVRSALIAADAAGSALPRVGATPLPWLRKVFDDAELCTGAFVREKVIERRTAVIEARTKTPFEWDKFQDRCEDLPDRALLLAPCGSGKTLAAWRWIAAQLSKQPAARVIFLYPTRATAKEGFRDYVSWAPEADAALAHGTAAFDLDGMFGNEDDPRHRSVYETDRRLYALGFWSRRVFSATVDQFLAFMQYGYGSVCLLPLLVDSVVVIDEVHSFDRSMFSALKDFLRTFELPVLCMTATLTADRRAELAAVPLQVCADKPGNLEVIAQAPRYQLRRVPKAEVEGHIRQALEDKKRVLWVVNQVRRAQEAARRLACDFAADQPGRAELHVGPGVPLFCYHSRFRLEDRVKRHDAVVEAFRPGCPTALAITTQVCEMSLDLDADLLVTEECPVTALIQRMGRCNRERVPRAEAGTVLVYRPTNDRGEIDLLPYDKRAMCGIEEFLASLSSRGWCASSQSLRRKRCIEEFLASLPSRGTLSQAQLEEALAAAPLPDPLGDKQSNFLQSGPYASGDDEEFRDAEDFTVRAVLASDLPRFELLRCEGRPTDGLIVPVPKRLGKKPEPRPPYFPRWLAVADDAHYHAAIGYCDQRLLTEGENS